MSMIGHFGLLTSDEVVALREPGAFAELVRAENLHPRPDRCLSVDKEWHAIHFLLNGKAWTGRPPVDFIIAGGTELAGSDNGHGPARVFSPEALGEIVRALRPVTDQELRANFTAEALASSTDPIYSVAGPSQVDELLATYHHLQGFLENGAVAQRALLVWLD